MSSTGRGSEREPDDFYSTPSWCVRAILPHVGPLAGKRILEPSAGRGSIVRTLIEAGAEPARLVAVERDIVRAAIVGDLTPHSTCDSFESWATGWEWSRRPRFDLIPMNPPFASAQAHVERAISLLAPGGTVAALLRLAFVASKGRREFRVKHPFDLYPLAARPSFTAEALAWMTEEDLLAQRKTVKETKKKPAHLETIDEVRSRLRGTDSADYAWLLFGDGRGGRFAVLEECDIAA